MIQYAAQIAHIGLGHLLLAACAGFYLAWWALFFRPGARADNTKAQRGIGYACIALAVVCGVAAVALVAWGLSGMPASLPPFIIVAGGIALYVILLGFTYIILNRPVTTELALMVGWLVLELCFLNGLASSGLVTGASLIIMGGFTFIAFIACIVCYALYYGLDGRRAFVDGLVPLAVVAFVALVFALLVH